MKYILGQWIKCSCVTEHPNNFKKNLYTSGSKTCFLYATVSMQRNDSFGLLEKTDIFIGREREGGFSTLSASGLCLNFDLEITQKGNCNIMLWKSRICYICSMVIVTVFLDWQRIINWSRVQWTQNFSINLVRLFSVSWSTGNYLFHIYNTYAIGSFLLLIRFACFHKGSNVWSKLFDL